MCKKEIHQSTWIVIFRQITGLGDHFLAKYCVFLSMPWKFNHHLFTGWFTNHVFFLEPRLFGWWLTSRACKFLWVTTVWQTFILFIAPRIMRPQNWWFGDPRPLRKTHPNSSFSQSYPVILCVFFFLRWWLCTSTLRVSWVYEFRSIFWCDSTDCEG